MGKVPHSHNHYLISFADKPTKLFISFPPFQNLPNFPQSLVYTY